MEEEMIRLPGMIDICTPVSRHNLREISQEALYRGVTLLIAAPEADRPFSDAKAIREDSAQNAGRCACDYLQIEAIRPDTIRSLEEWSDAVPAVLLDFSRITADPTIRMRLVSRLFNRWNVEKPILVRGTASQIGPALFYAQLNGRQIHICNVCTKDQIELIREAKENGTNVSCDANPLALVYNIEKMSSLQEKEKAGMPRFGNPQDQKALNENLNLIDCFSVGTSAGGTEVDPCWNAMMIPTLLALCNHNKLNLDGLRLRCCDNPRSIFHLPEQQDTFIDLDETILAKLADIPAPSVSNNSPLIQVTLHGEKVIDNRALYPQSI